MCNLHDSLENSSRFCFWKEEISKSVLTHQKLDIDEGENLLSFPSLVINMISLMHFCSVCDAWVLIQLYLRCSDIIQFWEFKSHRQRRI